MFNLIRSTYKKSTVLCMKQYEKPLVKSYDYYMLIARNKSL